MNEDKKMKVLVIGMSGAGKSTLIKSVSGKDVQTGVGEAVTRNTESYECDVWPLSLIDTQGFEFNKFRQLKSVYQISSYISKIKGIQAIWYCIDSETKRVDTENIKLLSKSIKGWNNMPLFIVLTKSYSKLDIPANVEAVEKAFANSKIKNIKGIIPIVAEDRKMSENVVVEKMGIEELCLKTIECWDEAVELGEDNLKKILNKKRFFSQSITVASTASAAAVGAIPLNFADAAILVPLETGMTTAILWNYDIKDKTIVSTVVGSQAITFVAKQVVSAIKTIPGVGDIVNAVVAGIIVFALGETVTILGENIYEGKISVEDLENIALFISDKLKENPILQETISYFEKNADILNNKNAKQIISEIVKNHKKKV